VFGTHEEAIDEVTNLADTATRLGRRPANHSGMMMAQFLRNTDAFVWSIESDPGLRSTIVTLILLDRSPDWSEVFNRFELLSRGVPTFRQRVVPSMPPAPPRWEADPDFDLAFHVRRVDAPAPRDHRHAYRDGPDRLDGGL
jgi:hypothetical protein